MHTHVDMIHIYIVDLLHEVQLDVSNDHDLDQAVSADDDELIYVGRAGSKTFYTALKRNVCKYYMRS